MSLLLTLIRYSTARSGLLNAARIARSISVRTKPMLSISAIAAFRCAPSVSAEGSLKLPLSVFEVPGAGDGVDGASAVELGAGAGAAGGKGVWAVVLLGVDGGPAAEDDSVGAVLGYWTLSILKF